MIMMSKLSNNLTNGVSNVRRPTYSPDLVPCDYFLLSKLKKKRFRSYFVLSSLIRRLTCFANFQEKGIVTAGLLRLIIKYIY